MGLIQSVQNGPASNPATWDSGTVPGIGDTVKILHEVEFDIPNWDIGEDNGGDALIIESGGKFYWNGTKSCILTLQGHFHQKAGGIVDFDGTSNRDKTLTIYLNKSNNPAHAKYNLILDDIVNVSINGYPMFSYVWAKAYPNGNTNIIQIHESDIDKIQDWQIGDELQLGDRYGVKLVTISDINYTTGLITFIDTVDFQGGFLANVTRNIKFESYEWWNTSINSHMGFYLQSSNIDGQINWTQFKSPLDNNKGVAFLNNNQGMNNCSGNVFLMFRMFSNYYKFNMNGTNKHHIFVANNFSNQWVNSIQGYIEDIVWIGGDTWNHGMKYWTNNRLPRIAITYCIWREGSANYISHYHTFVDGYFGNNTSGFLAETLYACRMNFENCYFENMGIYAIGDWIDFKDCKFGYIRDTSTWIKSFDSEHRFLVNRKQREYVYGLVSGEGKTIGIYDQLQHHDFYDYYQHAYNQDTVQFNNNKAIEIKSVRAGEFYLETKIPSKPAQFHNINIAMKKAQLNTTPPRIEIYNGNTIVTSNSMPDTMNNWEIVNLKWSNDTGQILYYTMRFVFTADNPDEYFWISDDANNFALWYQGYIRQEYVDLDATKEAIARQVEIQLENKFQEIKNQTDKLQFDPLNNIKSIAQNSEISEINFLKKIAINKAEIITNPDKSQTIRVYDDDGTTVLASFTVNKDKTLRLPQ